MRMLSLAVAALSLFSAISATPALAASSHYVRGFVTRNGTYVSPHRQTNPNGTKFGNWSTKGNINPYTGKAGTKNPN